MSDILEAGARALLAVQEGWTLERAAKWLAYYDEEMASYTKEATAVLAAVTPLIRNAALEEAAVVTENQPSAPLKIGAPQTWMKQQIAAAIRALKEQP